MLQEKQLIKMIAVVIINNSDSTKAGNMSKNHV